MRKQLLLIVSFFFACVMVCKSQTAKSPNNRSVVTEMPHVSVHFENNPLSEVLQQIAQKADIGIAYKTNIIPDKNVTYKAVDKNVYTVIVDLLEGTRLYVELSKNGKVILIKRRNQSYTVSGFVRDVSNGEALISANIYNRLEQNGAVTNKYGFFSYTTNQDSVMLRISFVGYQSEFLALGIEEDVKLNIALKPMVKEMGHLTVTANKQIEEETLMSSITVPVEQIKKMPHILGEVDVLKVLQLLPGVQGGVEGTSGLYIRGGEPGQNLILLDGVPVYNVSHLMGFVSIFNADAINNIELIKGGFPARYGGRLSSVIDIRLKEGNKEEISGAASVGILDAKLMINGPISDNMTFLISGRRTYADLLVRAFIPDDAGYYFYDLIGKTSYTLNDNDRFYVSGYFGNDRAYYFDPDRGFGMGWGNILTSLRWNHIYNPKLFSNVTLTYSRYRFDVSVNDQSGDDTNKIKYLSGIQDFAASIDFDYFPSPDHDIKFGGGFIRHRFTPGVFTDVPDEEDYDLIREETYSSEMFAYVEDDFQLTDRLKVNAGIRLSGYNVKGQFFHSVEPRLSFNYLLPGRIALKGSYARMTQYIHLLTNSGIGLPTDLWVPATPKVKPQVSRQWAVGLAKTFGGFEVSLEGYYKTMDNIIAYKEGASYLSVQDSWQDKVVSGEGESYGAELLVQKKIGKWSGWLGYTFAWSNRRFKLINFGTPFPYRYDRRHDINLALSYTPRKGLTLSANWVYASGEAITLPTARYKGLNQYDEIKYYEGRNAYRMPAYHRLDLSIRWTEDNGGWNRTWAISVYNAYNHKNPFFIAIQRRRNQRHFVQYSLFPIIPSISYSIKF